MDVKNNYNLGNYGIDVGKYKLLNSETEKKLGFESLNGNVVSRNRLITSNLRLVIKIAIKYQNMGLELDELISEGNKGLIMAVSKYNPLMDNKFSTYAYFWIKQSILSAIETTKQWSCTSNSNVLNYDSYEDINLSVNMNEFEFQDDEIGNIMRKIDGLPKRDSSIVKHYFGISGYSELNTVELSEKFKISTMRVSNIIENSIRKIRCKILENI